MACNEGRQAGCAASRPKVFLVGVGMGNPSTLTLAARDAIDSSDLLIGAPRLLEPFSARQCRKEELVRADDIADELKRASERQACVLLSGDVGFYSGARALYEQLEAFDIEVVPGISSLVYFCAKLRTPWQDAALVSAHGREHNAVGVIQSHAKTFCIAGGATRVEDICRDLEKRGLADVRVAVGERLSYDDERIVQGTAREIAAMRFDSLAVMLAFNERPMTREYGAPSLSDDDFERGGAPMTKEEVRVLAIAKLRIAPEHVVWDIGAGTGSVTVEAARAACQGLVCAVERDEEAADLVERSCQQHGCVNVRVVRGEAPQALADLPAPDRVFIGGSAGNLQAIVEAVLKANPSVRFCMTAVTLETMSDVLACLNGLGLRKAEIVQVSVSRAKELGRYHLMRAENPVYLVTVQAGGDAS